jgi:hypothetical protein
MNPALTFWLSGVVLAACVAGCAGPSSHEEVLVLPSEEAFAAVGHVFGAHCGTLDCHGDPARNLRVYGINGQRLDATDVPGFRGSSPAELLATYDSIVAIQPELLSAIVKAGGGSAGDWLVLGKARGELHHAGGQQFVPGQPADTGVLWWLASRVDDAFRAACEQGAVVFAPSEEW